MTLDDFPGHTERVQPPAGMTGESGPLLRLIRDQRVAFLIIGAINTLVGAGWFVFFHWVFGDRVHYLVTLAAAHVAAVLCAFVLYRRFVFRVTGHLLRDLWRFELVNLTSLAFNMVTLPLLVELAGIPVLPAQLIVTGATVLISYFGHRGFSFQRRAGDDGVADAGSVADADDLQPTQETG